MRIQSMKWWIQRIDSVSSEDIFHKALFLTKNKNERVIIIYFILKSHNVEIN